MPVPRDLGDVLGALARGATDQRVRIRGLTTEQQLHGLAHSLAVTTEALTATVALTALGAASATLRFLMIGKDTLDDDSVVLG
jgi:hypothetical protein